MKLRKILAPLAVSVVASAGLVVASANPAGASCAPRMFVVGGWQNGGLGEMLGSAPLGYEVQAIPYPNNWWDLNFQYDVDVGVGTLNWEVNQFYDNCGNPDAIIAGYSLGALVAGDVLATQPGWRNIQGILFSDGRRLPAYAGDPGGAEGNFPWAIPGNGLRGFINPTLTLCNAPDPVCFGGTDIPAYFTTHGAYNGFNVGFELWLHGWGNWKNIVY